MSLVGSVNVGECTHGEPARRTRTANPHAGASGSLYLITAELPGISPENVEVAVTEGMLTLKGHKLEEKKEGEKERNFHLWERSYGEFARSFRFPVAVNESKVAAEFTNGILKVTVPKMEIAPAQSRTVPIAKK
jgi:HSP20 family protein